MLTSGMVPALYPDDEKEAIIGQVSMQLIGQSDLQITVPSCVIPEMFPTDEDGGY